MNDWLLVGWLVGWLVGCMCVIQHLDLFMFELMID
jgi:hypothetical protein